MTKHSQGFSIVELVVILGVVLAAGCGGWYVWQNHKDGKQSGTIVQTSKDTQSKTDQQTDPSEGGKYLVIKEWGVRFPLPEDLRGDVYGKAYVDKFGSAGTTFGSKKLDGLVGDWSCTFLTEADGTIHESGLSAILTKINPDNPGQESLEYYRSRHVFVKKIGEFEYYYIKASKNPPITCLTGRHEEFTPVEQGITKELQTAFSNLEVYKQ